MKYENKKEQGEGELGNFGNSIQRKQGIAGRAQGRQCSGIRGAEGAEYGRRRGCGGRPLQCRFPGKTPALLQEGEERNFLPLRVFPFPATVSGK